MSGYPATPMYSLPPPQNLSPQASVPPWAAELNEDIKQLKSVLPSINKIDQTLTKINAKMYDLEIKVTSIDNRVTEVENSCKYMGQSFDQQTTELMNGCKNRQAVQKSWLFNEHTTKGKHFSKKQDTRF